MSKMARGTIENLAQVFGADDDELDEQVFDLLIDVVKVYVELQAEGDLNAGRAVHTPNLVNTTTDAIRENLEIAFGYVGWKRN